MKIITLLPLTKRAKQIVKQHGERWEVTQPSGRVNFSGQIGPWLFVTPITEPLISTTIREARDDPRFTLGSRPVR